MKIILEKANRGIALQQAGGIPSDVVTFMLANYIKINWRGAWSSEITYNYNDAVSYLGSSYVALRATTEQPSESAADWNLIAKKGEDGEDGRGIVSFELIDTQEKTKTYRMLFTDATYVDIAIIDGNDGVDGLTPYIGMNGNWWIGDVDQNIKAEGVDGISPTIGLNGNWYLGETDTGVKAQATSAYDIYLAGGGTLSEAEFNASITNIPSHIADDSIHHTIDELDVLYEPKNSNIQEHIADATKHIDTTTAEFSGTIDETNDKLTIWDNSLLKWIRFSFTSMKTWLSSLYLKLDQTTPQTIQGNVNINGNLNAVTTNVNQSTLPSVNASQDAAILQDGSAFTGTEYVMPTNNVAVKFVASAAHTMGDFTVRVKSSATLTSTTATLTGYLYSNNAGSPSTLLATGNAIRHGSITTSYQELSLGTQYNLIAGTTYWLVIRWSSAPTGGDIIFDSNSDTNGGATSSDATSWTLTNVRLRYKLRGRTFYGINAFSTNNNGLYSQSINGYGVYGTSTNGYGVYGESTNSYGVYGISRNNIGVRGESINNFGFYGSSTNSIGVRGASTNSYGVYGVSTNSFGVYGLSTNNFGFYGSSTNNRAGYFTRNTATPTNAVPVVEILQDHASDTNSVLDVKQDGTGEIARFFDAGVEVASIEKGGLGVYKKGVQIGDNTDVASYENRGATRYRENAGGSFYEMVMKKQDGSYAWVSLVSFQ